MELNIGSFRKKIRVLVFFFCSLDSFDALSYCLLSFLCVFCFNWYCVGYVYYFFVDFFFRIFQFTIGYSNMIILYGVILWLYCWMFYFFFVFVLFPSISDIVKRTLEFCCCYCCCYFFLHSFRRFD